MLLDREDMKTEKNFDLAALFIFFTIANDHVISNPSAKLVPKLSVDSASHNKLA